MRKDCKKNCINCKKDFVFQAGSKKEFGVRKFCSTRCNGLYYGSESSKRMTGKNNPMFGKRPANYKGYTYGFSGSRNKYKKLFIKGKYVWEHRWVMEKKLGRKLKKDEVVHHIDHNPKNNNPSNLKVMKTFEHSSYHGKLQGKK